LEQEKKEQIVLDWNGPLDIRHSIPYYRQKMPGLYIIEVDSEILYLGKSDEAAHKRAKDHFRGQGDSTGRWILNQHNEAKIRLWVGVTDWSIRISDAEWLLIDKLGFPPANVSYRDTPYRGFPLVILNNGKIPEKLSSKIEYP
jgi:hypothetical protein